jgi:hypothetical protein
MPFMRHLVRLGTCLAAIALGLALTACGGEDTRPATFSYIHAAILVPSCATASCHSDIAATVGVQLETKEGAYQTLVGHPCNGSGGDPAPRNFVDPGSPETSRLMYQLMGSETRQMPPDVALPEADIALVERWIQEGAQCN